MKATAWQQRHIVTGRRSWIGAPAYGVPMKRYRYSPWDGRQAFADVEADDVLDEAVDDLLQHGDLTYALRRLFEQGLTLRGGRRVEGIRDLLKRLQHMKR